MSKHPQKWNGQGDPDKYLQSDIRDAIAFRAWMDGSQMRDDAQWIVREKNIPASWYAIGF